MKLSQTVSAQPPVHTAVIPGDSQFGCETCPKPGDRIVGTQLFDGEYVGGRKSCAACEHVQPASKIAS